MNERFRFFLWLHYKLEPEDVVPTPTPGYWRRIESCGGREGGCASPLHLTLYCEGPTYHTIRYTDDTREPNGRWASPYRTWRTAVEIGEHELCRRAVARLERELRS